ncbi:helix-turn-helix domain-containing protein [Roseibium album]|uniref:helix-turn-helix domain-containing protein n=1 Tax=Roseibium album TaxID=311410 RepID=UPI0018CBD966|nr:AraC-like DNA-binding protein [Labrenzia sp. EL_162]MBG6194904.1 AraC-like DNA-binding protein [Labrenzia sp. EL_159]
MADALGIAVGAFGRVALLSATEPVLDHAHSQVHALIKLTGPDTVYSVDGKSARLTDTQMVLVNPWVVHSNQRSTGVEPTVLLALYIDTLWFGENGNQILAGFKNLPFAKSTATVSSRLQEQAVKLADQMMDMHSDEEQFDTLLRDLVWSVLQCSKTDAVSEQSTNCLFVSDHRIRRAVKAFRQEPSKELDLNDVARDVGLSRSQFYARFRQCTGLSPRTYLDTLCCERASHLLSDPAITIAEISELLGFSAQGHFTRFFKSKTGVSPNSFRMGHIEIGRVLR